MESKNGKQTLLWANTALTTMCVGVVAYLSSEVMNNGKMLIRIDERQKQVIKEIPAIQQDHKEIFHRLDKLEDKLTKP